MNVGSRLRKGRDATSGMGVHLCNLEERVSEHPACESSSTKSRIPSRIRTLGILLHAKYSMISLTSHSFANLCN